MQYDGQIYRFVEVLRVAAKYRTGAKVNAAVKETGMMQGRAARTSSRATIVCFGLLTLALPVFAQRSHSIQQACQQCGFRATRIVLVGQADGAGIIEAEGSLAKRDSRGNYFVYGDYLPYVKIFDRRGDFVRTLGRRGGGPGEFQDVARVQVLPGDTILVFDNSQARVTWYSPTFELIRTERLAVGPSPSTLYLPQARSFVLATHVATPGRAGYPLHLLQADRSVLRSFGSDGRLQPGSTHLRRQLSLARDGGFWAAHVSRYRIEKFSAAGELEFALERDVGWFPPDLPRTPPGVLDPPRPLLSAVHEDADGRLWISVQIASDEWREVRHLRPGAMHAETTDAERARNSMIEVIDVRTRSVIASERLPYKVFNFLGDGLLSTVQFTGAGVPLVAVWQLDF